MKPTEIIEQKLSSFNPRLFNDSAFRKALNDISGSVDCGAGCVSGYRGIDGSWLMLRLRIERNSRRNTVVCETDVSDRYGEVFRFKVFWGVPTDNVSSSRVSDMIKFLGLDTDPESGDGFFGILTPLLFGNEEIEYRILFGFSTGGNHIQFFPVVVDRKSNKLFWMHPLCVMFLGYRMNNNGADIVGYREGVFGTVFWNIDDWFRRRNPAFLDSISPEDRLALTCAIPFSGRIVSSALETIYASLSGSVCCRLLTHLFIPDFVQGYHYERKQQLIQYINEDGSLRACPGGVVEAFVRSLISLSRIDAGYYDKGFVGFSEEQKKTVVERILLSAHGTGYGETTEEAQYVAGLINQIEPALFCDIEKRVVGKITDEQDSNGRLENLYRVWYHLVTDFDIRSVVKEFTNEKAVEFIAGMCLYDIGTSEVHKVRSLVKKLCVQLGTRWFNPLVEKGLRGSELYSRVRFFGFNVFSPIMKTLEDEILLGLVIVNTFLIFQTGGSDGYKKMNTFYAKRNPKGYEDAVLKALSMLFTDESRKRTGGINYCSGLPNIWYRFATLLMKGGYDSIILEPYLRHLEDWFEDVGFCVPEDREKRMPDGAAYAYVFYPALVFYTSNRKAVERRLEEWKKTGKADLVERFFLSFKFTESVLSERWKDFLTRLNGESNSSSSGKRKQKESH